MTVAGVLPQSYSSGRMIDPSGGNGAVLSLEHVHVEFGPLTAVRDVSLSLNSGDLLGLIGPNGAGKTTLLRAIAGLVPLAAGMIHIVGTELRQNSRQVLGHIGFTPDTPPFYDGLTVRDFLRFIGRGYGLDSQEIEERVDFWLEKVWLGEKGNQKIKGLSRGMRQRVGIARTLLPNPAVVLLDEPAAGLDPAGRAQFRQLLCDLREQGKVLIVSSHILSDMEEYCTHIGIMQRGELVKYGTVAHVAGGADASRCRYSMLLAHPVAGLKEVLAGLPDVTGVEVGRDRVLLEYASGRDAATRLLADLVARRVPIASFTPLAPGIEEAYLRAGIGQVE